MEFKLEEEVVKSLELTETQVQKIAEFGTAQIASIRKELDDKAKEDANNYAEGILGGAAKYAEQQTSLAREKGEKFGDFLVRSGKSYLSEKTTELDKLKSDYEEKIKGIKDGSEMKKELEIYQKKVAELEPLAEFKTKYEELHQTHSALKVNTAFTKAMPKLPEGINEFEKKARENDARNEILSTFDIDFNEQGEPIAVDKTNKFSSKPLAQVLLENQSIKAMMEFKGASAPVGFGGKPTGEVKVIDGVPFEVTATMTSEERQQAIRRHLNEKEGLLTSTREYSQRYEHFNTLILKGLKK